MKSQSQALQFTGYPLCVVEIKQKPKKLSSLSVVKDETSKETQPNPKSKVANDPQNWDEQWFSSYE
jgi:hypothetical protein